MCFIPKEGITMKLKIMTILLLTGLLGGCMATVTTSGEIYTEALLPAPVVVERSYSRPVFVSAPRHHHRPMGPIAFKPRPGHRPGGHPGYRPHNPHRPGRR